MEAKKSVKTAVIIYSILLLLTMAGTVLNLLSGIPSELVIYSVLRIFAVICSLVYLFKGCKKNAVQDFRLVLYLITLSFFFSLISFEYDSQTLHR